MKREYYERILEGDNKTVADWMRTEPSSVLWDLKSGEWTGWQGNRLFDRPIRPTDRIRALAERQLQLREEAYRTVIDTLAAHGEVYDGSDGWWLLPCVDAEGRFGWVNSAKGRAYMSESEVRVPAEQIEAVTLPEQPSQALSGGTSMHDAAVSGSRNVELPDEWRQLLVDVRGGKKIENPAEPLLVAYGLQTCYGHRGGRPHDYVTHCEDVSREIAEALRDRAAQCVDAICEALESLEPEDPGTLPWPLWSSICKSFTDAIQYAELRECRLSALCSAADGHNYILHGRRGRLAEALRRIVTVRMRPILAAAPEISPRDTESGGEAQLRYIHWNPVMTAIIRQALVPHLDAIRQAIEDCDAILYRDGAVVTAAGKRLGVSCTSPPAKPEARIYERDGVRFAHVPHGADVPEGFSHQVLLAVDHAIYSEQPVEHGNPR